MEDCVYVVVWQEWETWEIRAVFTTKEQAKAYLRSPEGADCEWEEHDLDPPLPPFRQTGRRASVAANAQAVTTLACREGQWRTLCGRCEQPISPGSFLQIDEGITICAGCAAAIASSRQP